MWNGIPPSVKEFEFEIRNFPTKRKYKKKKKIEEGKKENRKHKIKAVGISNILRKTIYKNKLNVSIKQQISDWIKIIK